MRIKNIAQFQRAWKQRDLLVMSLFAVVLMIAIVLLISIDSIGFLWFGWIILGVGVLFWRSSFYGSSEEKSMSFLHGEYPDLEHSLRVVSNAKTDQSLLEKLQKKRIESRLALLDLSLPKAAPLLKDLLITTCILIAIPLLSTLWTGSHEKSSTRFSAEEIDLEEKELKPDSAYISDIRTTISPPAYTGLRSYTSEDMEHTVPEGSTVSWKFKENGPVENVEFVVGNDGKPMTAKLGSFAQQVMNSTIYYYVVNDQNKERTNSPYYSLKTKEDEKPTAVIKGIEEYQRLPWKKNHDIAFTIELGDDYGIEDAFLSATVAKGAGESVQFREKKFDLKKFQVNARSYKNQFQFSTQDFDMEPGSELYFYVMAKDNCPYRIQAMKSPTHFVILEDTTTYEYTADAGMQVDLMPDFFRSQRQIIIDSEKLLEEKASISAEEFKQRSNELGYDQKLLRLKYGQFLGEEAESGIAIENEIEAEEHDHDDHEGHDHGGEQVKVDILNEYGHNHDHEAEAGELLATKGTDPAKPDWVEEMIHSHDDAEVNTFLEVSLKTKLRAALSVMWDAELHLRLYDPISSLPFQYEALEFLQDIKNHARVYVHRIGFDPPAIKVAEKRLTGDQDKISRPTIVKEDKLVVERSKSKEFIATFSAASEQSTKLLSSSEKALLQSVGSELAEVAIEQPSLLPTLTMIRNVINSTSVIAGETLVKIRQGILRSMPEIAEEIQSDAHLFHPINSKVREALRTSR